MEINEEIYDNLADFINKLVVRIQKNGFKVDQINQPSNFSEGFFQLCKAKTLNLSLVDITNLDSYQILYTATPEASQEYLTESIKSFYTEIIELSKI